MKKAKAITGKELIKVAMASLKGSEEKVVILDFRYLVDYNDRQATGEYEWSKAQKELIEVLKSRREVAYLKLDKEGGIYKTYRKITVVRTMCREFKSLNDYLEKHCKAVRLNPLDVGTASISGKRSWYEVEGWRLLCHDAKKCNEIKDWIRTHRKSAKNNVIVTNDYRKEIFDKDAYYGEREWQGEEQMYLVVEIKSPTGRNVAKGEFYIF